MYANIIFSMTFILSLVNGHVWKNPDDIFGGLVNDDTPELEKTKVTESTSSRLDCKINKCDCNNNLLLSLSKKIQKLLLFSEDDDLDASINFSFVKHEVNLLKRYFKGKESIRDTEKVILNALERGSSNWNSYLPQMSFIDGIINKMKTFFFNPQVAIISLIMALLLSVVWCLVHFRSPRMTLFVLGLIMFLVSYGWNWNHHYQEALIKKEQVLLEMNYELPSYCISSSRTFFQQILNDLSDIMGLSTYSQSCLKYMKEKNIEPLAKVNPGVVFVDTISVMIFQPLKAVSYTINEMSNILSGNFPVFMSQVMKSTITLFLTAFFLFLFAWLIVSLFSEHVNLNLLNILSIKTGPPSGPHVQPNRKYLECVDSTKNMITMDVNAFKALGMERSHDFKKGSDEDDSFCSHENQRKLKKKVSFKRHISTPSFSPMKIQDSEKKIMKRRNSLDSFFKYKLDVSI